MLELRSMGIVLLLFVVLSSLGWHLAVFALGLWAMEYLSSILLHPSYSTYHSVEEVRTCQRLEMQIPCNFSDRWSSSSGYGQLS